MQAALTPAQPECFDIMHRLVLAALLLASPLSARASTPEDFSAVVAAALPGIVNITVWREGPLEGAAPSEAGAEHRSAIAGSGFVVDPSGIIVTNRHVVEGVSTISVGFSDRSRARAKVLALASAIDIAILKVEVTKPLPVLKFGDSDALKVGQPVICIGNPLGIGLTVSSGVISALNRDIHKTPFDDFIQSDCAINPGNSGGPMMNAAGEVIGVDTANIDPYGNGSIGLGFALTSNDVTFVVPRLIRMGRVNAGWIGLSMQDLSPEIARALAVDKDHGFIVNDVDAGGPADKAGFAVGDVVLDVADQAPRDVRALIRVIARQPVGAEVPVTAWRAGKVRRVMVKLGEFPGGPVTIKPPVDNPPPKMEDFGFTVEALMEPQPARSAGVVVTGVIDDSIASEAGIVVGTVILRVQQAAVGTAEDVAKVLDEVRRTDRKFVVLLVRGKAGEQRWVWLKV